MPLRSIVMYDGAHVGSGSDIASSLTLEGFYQAVATAERPGRTPIVGDGQPNFSEHLVMTPAPADLDPVTPDTTTVVNPFAASQGPNWDNPTISVPMPGTARSIKLDVNRVGLSSFDCLSFGAVVFSTEVQDTDNDGLLDVWEDADQTSTDPVACRSPT